MDSIRGITWERLERDSSVTYPCENEGDPGQPVVFQTHFPTATGRAKFMPADLIPAAERPDKEYPMVLITVGSRRGEISLYARADAGTPRGAVFMPFCYYEAAANLLTHSVLDPFGKIPEFKYCAVSVTAGGTEAPRLGYDTVAEAGDD